MGKERRFSKDSELGRLDGKGPLTRLATLATLSPRESVWQLSGERAE